MIARTRYPPHAAQRSLQYGQARRRGYQAQRPAYEPPREASCRKGGKAHAHNAGTTRESGVGFGSFFGRQEPDTAGRDLAIAVHAEIVSDALARKQFRSVAILQP